MSQFYYPAVYAWVNSLGKIESIYQTTRLFTSLDEAFKVLAYDHTGQPLHDWHGNGVFGNYKLLSLLGGAVFVLDEDGDDSKT